MILIYKKKEQETENIWSYFFSAQEPFSWLAGQSIKLELPRQPFGVSERRFTISSAPQEGDIRITTTLTDSDFKQSLDKLNTGELVTAYGPDGNFIYQEGKKLWLAGGLGITPFRSMLASLPDPKAADLALIASGQELPFSNWLTSLAAENKGLNFIYSKKRITIEDVAPYLTTSPCVYIAGPEQMVRELSLAIDKAKPGLQIKRDLFTGYEL